MHALLRTRRPGWLSYANVMSSLAVFLLMAGGSAYAAGKIRGNQIAKGTITGANIKARSLLETNFKKGELPRGPQGAVGPAGPAGPAGAAGAAGAAGSAKAKAFVTTPAGQGPKLDSNTGFPAGGVTNPSPGTFCIKTPANYNPDTDHVLLTLNGFGYITYWSPQQCGGSGNIQVATYDGLGDRTNLSFTVAII